MSKTKSLECPPALLGHVIALPFDAYARLLALLLEKLGYKHVTLAGRTDWKGRNRSGGFDLVATLPGGVAPRHVVVQVKQFDASSRIFQRQVDELRGAAIRAGASEAVLITTGPVSRAVDFQGLASPILPIRLIEGEMLARLLTEYQVGVHSDNQIDIALFARLTQEARGNGREDCLGRSGLVVSVEILKVSKRGTTAVRKTTLPTLA